MFKMKSLDFIKILILSFGLLSASSTEKIPVTSARILDDYESIVDLIHYPEYALDYKIKGKSLIAFKVLEDGSVNDALIIQSLGYSFDREIINGLKSVNFNFVTNNTYSKKTLYRMSIFFQP